MIRQLRNKLSGCVFLDATGIFGHRGGLIAETAFLGYDNSDTGIAALKPGDFTEDGHVEILSTATGRGQFKPQLMPKVKPFLTEEMLWFAAVGEGRNWPRQISEVASSASRFAIRKLQLRAAHIFTSAFRTNFTQMWLGRLLRETVFKIEMLVKGW